MQGPPERPAALAVLAVLAALSQASPSNKIAGTLSLSIHSVVVLAAVVIVGPVGAALVAGAAFVMRLRTLAPRALAFNIGMSAACAAVSGVAYISVGGVDPEPLTNVAELLTTVAFPLMVADVIYLMVNISLVSGIQMVSRGVPFRAQFVMLLTGIGASYLAYGVIALLLVLVWLPGGVGFFSIVLVIAPLVAAQWGLGQFGAELTAHNRTLGALVAAIETKSPASTGQSALVAELSESVAEELALPSRDVEAARTAGMLHDVGLLAVPAPLLDPTRVLSPGEQKAVHHHLAEAAGMLRGISFLDRALVGIVHHGERVDGTGYPSRLTGDQIPPIARIVAVAGGYASLRTPRTDRPALTPDEAVGVLRELAGTAYDPPVVAALGRAVSRHSQPVGVEVTRTARLGSAVALDDPAVGLRNQRVARVIPLRPDPGTPDPGPPDPGMPDPGRPDLDAGVAQ